MTFRSIMLAPTAMISLLIIVASASRKLENMEVVRYIDISTQLVIVSSHIKVINNNTDPVEDYIFTIDSEWVDNLSFIEVLDGKKNLLLAQNASKIELSGKSMLQYTIVLCQPLYSGERTEFVVSLIVTNYLKSYPKKVKQNEKHFVLFPFNVYHNSMYFSHVQMTYLHMGTTKAALVDGYKYTLARDSEYGFQYGPFYDVEPFEYAQSVFHFENNAPFLVAAKVTRHIKLSHWGFVSVWDKIELVHSGPKLEGPFKRSFHTYQKQKATKDTRIEEFISTLPNNAFNVYLKDDIGLISSFAVDYEGVYGVDVKVAPRHILYGGWKTAYEIGYSLPIGGYVTSLGNEEFHLSFPLVDRIFKDMVVQELEINIILPEGANFRTTDSQSEEGNKTSSKYCYYFDTICREVVTFKRYNVVEKHIYYLTIGYTFSQFNLFVKPMVVAMFLFFTFILLKVSSLSLLPFSIQTEKEVKDVHHKNDISEPLEVKKKKKIPKRK